MPERRKEIIMKNCSILPTLALFLVLPISAHELTYDGKICECLGDLDHDDDVDADDIPLLLDRFDDLCSNSEGCAEDLNHNHRVGEGDLRVLLAHWGPCREEGDVNGDGVADQDDYDRVLDDQGKECGVDIDGDGRVGGNDITIAEAAWGPGDDHHPGSDVDGNGSLSVLDLLAVVESLGRNCQSDIDGDGLVSCADLGHVCELGQLSCPAAPVCVPAP